MNYSGLEGDEFRDHTVELTKEELIEQDARRLIPWPDNAYPVEGGAVVTPEDKHFGGLPPNPKQAYGDKKPPLHLVPPAAMAYAAMALKNGAAKYGAYNWRDNDVELMTYIGACQRHIGEFMDGQEYAEDSGVHHLAHALACLCILIDAKENGNLLDNRPPQGPMSDTLKRLESTK